VANMCAAAAKPSAGQRNAVKDEQECRHAAWLMRWIDLPIREIVESGDSTSVVCPSNGQPIASDIDKNQDDAVHGFSTK
jgi:hypothetical protein